MTWEIDLENLTEEAIIEAYMFGLRHHLGDEFIRDNPACKVLRECILREYSMSGFDMKGLRSPFADCKVSKDMNNGDYELPQLDAYEYFLTWADYGSLPDPGMDRYAIACVYPVVRPDWDGMGGFYALAVAYWDSRQVGKIEPMSDWSSADVQWITQKKGDIYAQGYAKHHDWLINPSPYFRNTWGRHKADVWKRRDAIGIPLTPWQQEFADAGGWPARTEPMERNLPGKLAKQAAASALQKESEKGANDGNLHADTAGGDSGGGGGVDAGLQPVEGEMDGQQSDSDNLPDSGSDRRHSVDALVAHCVRHREKYTFRDNPHHHHRWNKAIDLLKGRDFKGALQWAKPYACKGWKPWKELIQMINDD